jgi:predicted ABC-type transport system involved in lysophospholipase L1 biosynthesis ATPase subunit
MSDGTLARHNKEIGFVFEPSTCCRAHLRSKASNCRHICGLDAAARASARTIAGSGKLVRSYAPQAERAFRQATARCIARAREPSVHHSRRRPTGNLDSKSGAEIAKLFEALQAWAR